MGRPKKTAETGSVTNAEAAAPVQMGDAAVDIRLSSPELEELKKENAELKAQLQAVLGKLSEKTENPPVDRVGTKPPDVIYKEINPMKLINVVSLSDGGVTLRTAPSGGIPFRFDKFGHTVAITYNDLQNIISTDRSFIEDGSVYICDPDVVRNNYLEDVYSKFLTVDMINNIFTFPTEKIVDIVSNTTETIQESIISLIVKKINNNEYVDMNKVDAIGKACKTPCDISGLALQKRAR